MLEAARIAASSSLVGSLKFCVVARNSTIGTPSAIMRCANCVAAQGHTPHWRL
jgi:hypothetical protein